MNFEDHKKAKNRKQLRELYTNEFTPLLNYTQKGLAWAYISDSDPDSVQVGKHLLRSNTASYDEEFRRKSLKQYIHFMELEGETGFVREALDTLATLGNRRQQAQVKLKRIGFEIREQNLEQAIVLWESLNSEWELGLTTPTDLQSLSMQENGQDKIRQQLVSEAQVIAQLGNGGRRKQALRQRLMLRRGQMLMVFLEQWEQRNNVESELDELVVMSTANEQFLADEERFEKQELRQKQRERKEKREKRREEKRKRELAQQENQQ